MGHGSEGAVAVQRGKGPLGTWGPDPARGVGAPRDPKGSAGRVPDGVVPGGSLGTSRVRPGGGGAKRLLLSRGARALLAGKGTLQPASGEPDTLPVPCKVGKGPRDEVRQVDKPEIGGACPFCQLQRLLVVHVLGEPDLGRNDRIQDKEVDSREEFLRPFGNICPGIACVCHGPLMRIDPYPEGGNGGVVHREEGDRDPEDVAGSCTAVSSAA